MPNDTLAQAVARAMCGSREICPACMEEAHGVIAAIRATPGWALVRTEGEEFEAAVDRMIAECNVIGAELGLCEPVEATAEEREELVRILLAALNQPTGETA